MPEEIKLYPINAFDEEGRSFRKEPTIRSGSVELEELDPDSSSAKYGYYGRVIDFGWPVEYYINALLQEYPYEHALCIDAGGRNHLGSAVYIPAEDLNRILADLPETKNPLPKPNRDVEVVLMTAGIVDMRYATLSRAALNQMVETLKEKYPGHIHFDETNGIVIYKGPIDLIVDSHMDPLEIFHKLKKGKFDAHVKAVLQKGERCKYYLMQTGCSLTGTEQANYATLECVCKYWKEEGND